MFLHKQKIAATALTILLPFITRAQEAAPAVANAVEDKSWFNANPVLMGLAIVLLFLLLAVYITSRVIRNLSGIASNKIREERKQKTNVSSILVAIATLGLTMASSTTSWAQDVAADAANSVINNIPKTEFYVMIIVLLVFLAALAGLLWRVNKILQFYRGNQEVAHESVGATAKVAKGPSWMDRFNKSVAIEKEQDVLLDHNYDGIQELDNSLPPWWLYGFYATIIFACIYLWRAHVSHTAPSSAEEYIAEVQKGDEEKAKFLATAGNNVDENTVTLSTNAADLAAGKQIFETTCSACHLKDGGGSVGPNLTDNYWLHGGSIKDVFKTIKYGVVEKGMQSWKDTYTPVQISQLSSFIMSLKGTKPAVAKEPQGDLFTADASAASTDAAAADTTQKNTVETGKTGGVNP